ncbi:hypothetical protein DFJ73DRAFT_915088 [Zopfochytrium polystomum]|nr:hypothetical protein DFJ73DRAFT_915088 [Zopfochytrium polystomum]
MTAGKVVKRDSGGKILLPRRNRARGISQKNRGNTDSAGLIHRKKEGRNGRGKGFGEDANGDEGVRRGWETFPFLQLPQRLQAVFIDKRAPQSSRRARRGSKDLDQRFLTSFQTKTQPPQVGNRRLGGTAAAAVVVAALTIFPGWALSELVGGGSMPVGVGASGQLGPVAAAVAQLCGDSVGWKKESGLANGDSVQQETLGINKKPESLMQATAKGFPTETLSQTYIRVGKSLISVSEEGPRNRTSPNCLNTYGTKQSFGEDNLIHWGRPGDACAPLCVLRRDMISSQATKNMTLQCVM